METHHYYRCTSFSANYVNPEVMLWYKIFYSIVCSGVQRSKVTRKDIIISTCLSLWFCFFMCLYLLQMDYRNRVSESPAAFNKAASEQYRMLRRDEKEGLKEKIKEVKIAKLEVIKLRRKFLWIFGFLCVSTFVQYNYLAGLAGRVVSQITLQRMENYCRPRNEYMHVINTCFGKRLTILTFEFYLDKGH